VIVGAVVIVGDIVRVGEQEVNVAMRKIYKNGFLREALSSIKLVRQILFYLR